jgi:hypothetical protein
MIGTCYGNETGNAQLGQKFSFDAVLLGLPLPPYIFKERFPT